MGVTFPISYVIYNNFIKITYHGASNKEYGAQKRKFKYSLRKLNIFVFTHGGIDVVNVYTHANVLYLILLIGTLLSI